TDLRPFAAVGSFRPNMKTGGSTMRCAGLKLVPSFEVLILIFMSSLVFGQSQTAVVPGGMDHILYGAAYYHEYMPYERLDKDVALMQKAGLNVVRMGESTWSLWEPEDGRD